MSLELAHRLDAVKPSPTLAVAAKAQQMKAAGRDIVSLGTGEPDFDTPDNVKEAAIEAIHAGFNKYTAVDGIMDLKLAVISKFERENKLRYQPDHILVSTGAKQGLYNLCQAFLSPGDEVLIPAPYWVSYPDMVLLAGGVPKIISTDVRNRFKLHPDQLEASITSKTKLLFLNSPSNPTGVSYTLQELEALANVLLAHPHVLIASDDIYEHILWNKPFVNILNACPDLYSRVIVFNGVSKAYAMTGWRIGYAAGPATLIHAMTTIQSQSTSNPCSIAQKAAVAALNGPQDALAKMVEIFKQRHDYVVQRLKTMPSLHFTPADGTFYLFPQIQDLLKKGHFLNDIAFADKLLEDVGLALVPGSAFGIEGYIRLSFATSMNNLQKAMDRLEQFCATVTA